MIKKTDLDRANENIEVVTKLLRNIPIQFYLIIFILPFIVIPISFILFFFSVNFSLYLLAVSALIIAWFGLCFT